MQLHRALLGLLGLIELRGGSLDVGRLLDRRQMVEVGAAVASQGPRERRLLLVEAVRGFFAIQFDEHLAFSHAIAKVGRDPSHHTVGLRRHDHLVGGRECRDDVERSADGFLDDGRRTDGAGRRSFPGGLPLGLCLGTGGNEDECEENEEQLS